jgi:hypothetical protein
MNAVIAIAAIVGCGSANAQQTFDTQPTTIEMTSDQYDAIQVDPQHRANLIRLDDQTFRVVQNVTPEVVVGTGGPGGPVVDPCVEQMTPAYRAYCQAQANMYCMNYRTCVQGANCAWYAYVFLPNSPNCPQSWEPYNQYMQAYRY